MNVIVESMILACCCAGIHAQQVASEPAGSRPDHAAFDRILRRHVRHERVDYLSLRKLDWDALIGYLDQLAKVNASELSRDEQLAFYINLYNATMIRSVIERLTDVYSPSATEYAVFSDELVRLDAGAVSLNQLENDIIRPTFREPLVHVALVCGAQSCPPILARAYRADDLDVVLRRNMTRFLDDSSRNRVDADGRKLLLSKIFDWYSEDFGGPAALPSYVSEYLVTDNDVSDYSVEFVPYSWRLNIAPPASGQWVSLRADTALSSERGAAGGRRRAGRGRIFEVLGQQGDWLELAVPFGAPNAWVRVTATVPYPR